jgi:hypothetical protein
LIIELEKLQEPLPNYATIALVLGCAKKTHSRNMFPVFVLSSQVKLLNTINAFCIVQRSIALSKTGIFRDYDVAEASPGFQAGWSDF